jgi:hypothetical protein
VDAKTKESTRKTEENWMEGIKKAMNERNLNEVQFFFFSLPRALFCFGIHFNAILGNLSLAIL